MKKSLFIVLLSSVALSGAAQGIRGGEIRGHGSVSSPNAYASVHVQIYREGPAAPHILFEWGDGAVDTLPLSGVHPISQTGVSINQYYGFHYYDTLGVYALAVTDGFLIPGIANIPDSETKMLELRDTISLDNPADFIVEGTASLPVFINRQTAIEVLPNGAIRHNPAASNHANRFFSYLLTELAPWPASGYAYPAASDSIGCCIIWDRPLAPGRYAFAIKARSLRFADHSLFATATRFMVIDVDSAMLVSAPDIWPALPPLSLYPNPASETLYLSFGEPLASPAELRVFSLAGQEAYRAALPGGLAGQAWEIPVAGWPAGVYVVRVIAGGRSWVERVIKR
jgi:hypothetical protein